ncbi:LysR substrate-binding domain-containing protein [Ideonella sp. BN130291]|uniref:LysR substrate-binding domain-containing protein n=1 Tax=Ideonella sp. BN130291 TaxID=3112940 RepID=UPI002E263D9A|nr:LysR substrate-binding domain-containing protein [Ideonella sp. BN130291]
MTMDPPSLPPLDGLRVAVLAARMGSFSAAAQSLGLTHGAVSRRVASVESWLGTPLFTRAGRGVTLTPEGQRLIRTAEQAMDAIGRCAEQWRPHRGLQTVKVSVVPSLARLWLLPRMRALQGEPADLRIDLDVEHSLADVQGGQVDLAIRYGSTPGEGLDACVLMRERLLPVASPELAGSLGARPKAAELHRLPLVHDSDLRQWQLWFADTGLRVRPRGLDRRFEDYDLVLLAAEQGLGVALARLPIAQAWLDAGRLVPVSTRRIDNPLAHQLVLRRGESREAVLEAARRLRRLAGA